MPRLAIIQGPTREQLDAALENPDYTVHFVLKTKDGTEYEATGSVVIAPEVGDLFQVCGDLLSTDWSEGSNFTAYAAWWLSDTGGIFEFGM